MNWRVLIGVFLVLMVAVLCMGTASADYYDGFNNSFELGSTMTANLVANFTSTASEVELFPSEKWTVEGVTNQTDTRWKTVYARFNSTNSSSQQYWGISLYNSSDTDNHYSLYRNGFSNYDRYNDATHSYLSGSDNGNDIYIYIISQNDTHINSYASFNDGDTFTLLNSTPSTAVFDVGGVFYSNSPSTIYYETCTYDYMFLGNDEWNGTVYDNDEPSIPGTTIEKHYTPLNYTTADSEAWVAGTTVYFGGGTYTGEYIHITNSGTEDNPIIITNESGEEPVFDNRGQNISYNIQIMYDGSFDGYDWVYVSNLKLLGTSTGVKTRNNNNIYIDNMWVQNTTGTAYDLTDGVDIKLTNSTAFDNGWNTVQVAAIWRDSYNVLVSECNFSENTGHNLIDLMQNEAGKYVKDVIIDNNLLSGKNSVVGCDGVFTHCDDIGYFFSNISITNNTFIDGLNSAVYFGQFENSVISGNLISAPSVYGIISTSTGLNTPRNITIQNNRVIDYVGGSLDSRLYLSEMENTDIIDNEFEVIRLRDGNVTIDESKIDFIFNLESTDTQIVKSSSGKLFSVDGENVIYDSDGGEILVAGDADFIFHWNNNYTLVPTSSVTVTNVSDTGCTVTLASAENVTFGEVETGNTITFGLSSGSTDIMFSSLDFTSDGVQILSFAPIDLTPTTTNGTPQTFTLNLVSTGNVTTYLDNVSVQFNESVTSASYTNTNASAGVHNVTASANYGSTEVSQTWTWTVTEEPVASPTEDTSRTEGAETALAMVGVLLVILVATAIIGSLVGIITGVLDVQSSVVIIFTFLVVAVLGYIGLSVLSGISGALNL